MPIKKGIVLFVCVMDAGTGSRFGGSVKSQVNRSGNLLIILGYKANNETRISEASPTVVNHG